MYSDAKAAERAALREVLELRRELAETRLAAEEAAGAAAAAAAAAEEEHAAALAAARAPAPLVAPLADLGVLALLGAVLAQAEDSGRLPPQPDDVRVPGPAGLRAVVGPSPPR